MGVGALPEIGPVGGVVPAGIEKRMKNLRPAWTSGTNPTGNARRGKGWKSLRRRFREAFDAEDASHPGEKSLVDVVLGLARGRIVKMIKTAEGDFEWAFVETKTQMAAIEFAASYGFGAPPKGEEDLTALLEPLVKSKLAEMLADAEAAIAAENRDGAITVTAQPSGTGDGIEKP